MVIVVPSETVSQKFPDAQNFNFSKVMAIGRKP